MKFGLPVPEVVVRQRSGRSPGSADRRRSLGWAWGSRCGAGRARARACRCPGAELGQDREHLAVAGHRCLEVLVLGERDDAVGVRRRLARQDELLRRLAARSCRSVSGPGRLSIRLTCPPEPRSVTGAAAMVGATRAMTATPATAIPSARRAGLRIQILLVRVDLLAAGAASTLGSPILGDAGEVCHTRPAAPSERCCPCAPFLS